MPKIPRLSSLLRGKARRFPVVEKSMGAARKGSFVFRRENKEAET